MPAFRKSTLAQYRKKMADWPKTWAGMPEDVPFGEALAAAMMPFVEHLTQSGLAPSTIRRHLDNLWVLGGKIVRDAALYEQLDQPPEKFLNDAAGPFDGPPISDLSQVEQRSLDATCRKMFRFFQGKQSLPSPPE